LRLIDLGPRWFTLDGQRVGLTFECPDCRHQRLGVCFHHRGRETIEDQYIMARHGASDSGHIWTLDGQDNFETLTLSPSIDASVAGHWHGWIQNGQVTNA
jgi:hypothetical protein